MIDTHTGLVSVCRTLRCHIPDAGNLNIRCLLEPQNSYGSNLLLLQPVPVTHRVHELTSMAFHVHHNLIL
jgi:hypothetical protein